MRMGILAAEPRERDGGAVVTLYHESPILINHLLCP